MKAQPEDAFGVCVRCDRPVRVGQPYAGVIPFVGTFGGIQHQFCPPQLVQPTATGEPR